MGQHDWEAAQAARAFTAKQLQAAHPHLVAAGDKLTTAAKNIRIELKRAFPTVKFAVKTWRFSMGNSISVHWTDGPTSDQVEEIANRYESGSFDGQTDCYNYENSAWKDAFGEGKYVSATRHYSDNMVAGAIRRTVAKLGGMPIVPSVEDYRQGRTWNVKTTGGCDFERELNVALSRHTYCLAQA